jgi:hypothetical protein
MQKAFRAIILFPCIILLLSETGCSKDKTGQPILLLAGSTGKKVAYTKRSVRGYDYAFLAVEPGADYTFKIAFDN